MAFQVSDDVLRSAKDCPKDLRCLEGVRPNLCQVKECVGGEVHFIECRTGDYCPYQQAFGHGRLCTCPVRKELYRIYRV